MTLPTRRLHTCTHLTKSYLYPPVRRRARDGTSRTNAGSANQPSGRPDTAGGRPGMSACYLSLRRGDKSKTQLRLPSGSHDSPPDYRFVTTVTSRLSGLNHRSYSSTWLNPSLIFGHQLHFNPNQEKR